MSIEISREASKTAIASIERYFRENMEEPIGNVTAVAEAQERMQARVMELDIEIHEDEFPYWRKVDRQRKSK